MSPASSSTSLAGLGLGTDDSALYEDVVRHPGSAIADAAARTHLSEKRARQGLARLVALGLVSRSADRAPTYIATPPESALTALVHQREAEFVVAREAVRRLATIYQKGMQYEQPSGLVEVVTGTEAITRISWQLISGAKDQIRWFDRPPYPNDPPNALLGAERAALVRGIRERVIFASAGTGLPGRMKEIEGMASLGQQVRVLPDLPVKMGIIDDRLAILPVITPSHTNDAAYLVHPSSLLDALMALFEDHWSHALPLTTSAGDSGSSAAAGQPSDQERRLLVLLGSGLTDEAIARATGAGLRTVQRHIHDLMETMHVQTRFQAGLVARDNGWLPRPDPS